VFRWSLLPIGKVRISASSEKKHRFPVLFNAIGSRNYTGWLDWIAKPEIAACIGKSGARVKVNSAAGTSRIVGTRHRTGGFAPTLDRMTIPIPENQNGNRLFVNFCERRPKNVRILN